MRSNYIYLLITHAKNTIRCFKHLLETASYTMHSQSYASHQTAQQSPIPSAPSHSPPHWNHIWTTKKKKVTHVLATLPTTQQHS